MTERDGRAMLVLDATCATVRPSGRFGQQMDPATDFEGIVRNMRSAVQAARDAGDTVVWVVPGADFIRKVANREADPEDHVPDEIVGAPADGELLIEKASLGAFEGSALESALRDRNVSEIVVAGIATQFVVAATVREAVARDFKVTVLEDAGGDVDADTHVRELDELRAIAKVARTAEVWSR